MVGVYFQKEIILGLILWGDLREGLDLFFIIPIDLNDTFQVSDRPIFGRPDMSYL